LEEVICRIQDKPNVVGLFDRDQRTFARIQCRPEPADKVGLARVGPAK
jgi:hypothetical protein